MGGFMGIGTSAEAKELEMQNQLKRDEAERARRDAEIRLAEKKARKGQETANIKLGTNKKSEMIEEELPSGKTGSSPSSSLGLGSVPNKSKTGIQL